MEDIEKGDKLEKEREHDTTSVSSVEISSFTYPLVQNYKTFHDTIHGYISVSNYACRIIDTKYFQQLRYKKQLGTAYLVFPNAVHTRFEHSIGTYNFASTILDTIMKKTKNANIQEYLNKNIYLTDYFKRKYSGKARLDDYICELVKIAALCHDIGHGPFSHVFDDHFLKDFYKDYCESEIPENITHETRSAKLIEKIIKDDEILSKIILDSEIEFIKSVINPKNNKDTSDFLCKGFLYQIVSNNLNGLDVDKYDYLIRDSYVLGLKTSFDCSRMLKNIMIINNNICYPEQISYDIYEMFNLRYRLHKQIYCHKSVVSTQYMIVEIMELLEPYLKISESILDLDKFIKLSDDFILSFVKFYELTAESLTGSSVLPVNLIKARNLISRIESHDMYAFIDTIVSERKINLDIETLKCDAIFKKHPEYESDIIIFNSKIGFVSGDKSNPLDNVFCYSTKSLLSKEVPDVRKLKITEISLLVPKLHQEYITMIFYKNRERKKNIAKLKEIIARIKLFEI